MKRKRFEYNLVDEYLNQREKDTLKALKALKKMKEPKKPLLVKVNVTKRNRKPHP